MSPHPVLVTSLEQIRQEVGASGVATGSLRREQPERLTLLESLATLHVHGQALMPKSLFPAGGRRVELPTYAWQRQRYWVDGSSWLRRSGGVATGHPLLGARISAPAVDAAYESVLSATEPSWLGEHRVGGQVVVPGAAVAELVRAAAEEHRPDVLPEIRSLVLQSPLVLPEHGGQRVQVVLTEQGTRAAIYSQSVQAVPAADWTLHATAEVGEAVATSRPALDLTAARDRCAEAIDVETAY